MQVHWSDDYYGDLYYESVADLLTARMSGFEAKVLRRLLGVNEMHRVLDLACGHGRHARALSPEVGLLVGLDRNPEYLARARHAGAVLVQGDLRALPLRPGSFDAVYSWYSSLFMYDDEENARCLAAAVALLRPGGRLLVHHDNPARLRREPTAAAAWDLPRGGRVEEDSRYDPSTGRDSCTRRVIRPDGSVLAGVAHLRYYTPEEWKALAGRCGLELLRITSTWQADRPAERLDDDAPDLIALGRRSA
ncbi:MAG: class I SAM-dependent methyltransferase [Anaeromyxobacteraceae bacterium]